MSFEEVTLIENCAATVIPAGDEIELKAGVTYTVSQALGGSVTLRDRHGLYRVAKESFAALGPTWQARLEQVQQQNAAQGEFSEEMVWDALRQCFDPEIPVNIVDLGLIYDLQITPVETDLYDIAVRMTLTATGCGMGPTIAADARDKIEALQQVRSAEVDIVWDPQWTPQMISEEGRKILGLN